mgnify:CR=1 FL=1
MELFFDNINGNILLRRVVNELNQAMSFPSPKKVQPGRDVFVGIPLCCTRKPTKRSPHTVSPPECDERGIHPASVALSPARKSIRSSNAGHRNARSLHRLAPDRCSRRHGNVPASSADPTSKTAAPIRHRGHGSPPHSDTRGNAPDPP